MPCRTATLTFENRTGEIIHGLTLRERGGGPTFYLPTTIPPDTTRVFTVPLLAVAVRQTYTIGLMQDSAPGAGARMPEYTCEIEWPTELVNPEAIIDPELYRSWQQELAAWPAGLIRNVFLAGALTCLALAAVLLVRRPALRAAAVAAIVIVASASVWEMLQSAQTVICSEDEAASLIALTCRRSTEWRRSGRRIVPVYRSKAHMARDKSGILLGHDPVITVRLRPSEVQLLRLLGAPLTAQPPPGQ